jgi:hypothetical protein
MSASTKLKQELFGLPSVLPLESPASWLSRASLTQGVPLKELLEFLGLDRKQDTDVAFLSDGFAVNAIRCGLSLGDFAVAQKIIRSAFRLDRSGQRLLLRDSNGRPRYRACPRCASEQQTAFFGIHARFICWRFCPLHHCLLEDACWSCGTPIELPVDFLTCGPAVRCRPYLSHCSVCGKSHGQGTPALFGETWTLLAGLEQMILNNGRATLSALVHQKVVTAYDDGRPLSFLRGLEATGMLGTRGAVPTAAQWRERLMANQGDPLPG